MLFDLSGKQITHVPHKHDYDTWRSRISDADYDGAVAAIREYMAEKEVFNSGFIPGNDWTGTPYQPLYLACGQSFQQSGFFFGLIVWITVMDDPDEWLFKPSDKDGQDPLGMSYWRKNQ
jgi:hypothetical protein